MKAFELLKLRYAPPEWGLFFEVNGAGNFADAVAINMWSSRGYVVHGFEKKASRSDWLRELKKPQKPENIFKFCDFWWLLIEDESIAKLAEVPISWGLMTVRKERLKILKEAPKLKPQALSREFIASVMRRAHQSMDKMIYPNEIAEKIKEAEERGRKWGTQEAIGNLTHYKELEAAVKEFEDGSGIKIYDKWNWQHKPEKLGKALKFILDGGIEKSEKDLQRLLEQAKKIYDFLEQHKLEFANDNGTGILPDGKNIET